MHRNLLESLESRAMLSVAAAYSGSWTTGTHLCIAVDYTSENGVDTATLDGQDVVVRRGASEYSAELASVAQIDGPNRVRAMYRMRAPGNWWDAGDNGAYTSGVRAGEVADLGGAVAAQTDLHTNNLWFPRAFAAMVSSTVNSSEWLINVRYEGIQSEGIPLANLGLADGNLLVSGPSGPLATSLHQLHFVDGAIVATYRADAPGGAWDSLESGRYTVTLRGGQVLAPFYPYRLGEAPLGASELWFNSPRAEGLGATNEGAAIAVRVRFESIAAINLLTLGDADIVAVRADGVELAMVRATDLDGIDGNGYIAGYRLLAPGGAVSNLMQSRYDFRIRAGEVGDVTGGSTLAQQVGTIEVYDEASAATVVSAVVESATTGSTAHHRWIDVTVNFLTVALSPAFVVGATLADVTTPHGLTLAASVTSKRSIAGGLTQAQLRILAPDGFINFHDNGQYSVVIREGYLFASASQSRPARAIGTFDISGQSNPRVEILAHHFTETEWLIDVRLSDDNGINEGSLLSPLPLFTARIAGNYNVRFNLHPASAQPDGSYLLTLRGQAPAGGWTWRHSGTAELQMFGALFDANGNRSGRGAFRSMPIVFDTPIVQVTPRPAATEGHWQVSVRFDARAGFISSAFRDGDLTATGPSASIGASRLLSATQATDGSWTVVYEFAGAFTAGTHSISLLGEHVLDTQGQAMPARTLDTSLTVVSTATSPGAWATRDALVVQVDYRNAASIDESSFGIGDIVVARGAESLSATRVARIRLDSFTWRVAYTFAPFGGEWNPGANGAWTASITPGAVARTDGSSVPAGTLRTMNLVFAQPVTASWYSSTITATSWLVNIRFDGPALLSSIDSGDVRVIGRTYMPSTLHQLQYINGAVVATYRFDAPGGAWDYEDSGAYTIELIAGAVRDSAGLALNTTTFAPVSLWFAQPAAYVTSSEPTANEWLIDLHYGGLGGMNAATLGNDDLTLTRAGVTYSVTFVGWNTSLRLATYRVNPINGGWSSADNGAYSLSINANAVYGADGTAALGRTLGTVYRYLG